MNFQNKGNPGNHFTWKYISEVQKDMYADDINSLQLKPTAGYKTKSNHKSKREENISS